MYAAHEKQKMTKYNHRVIQIEKSTFAPLCFSTTGGMGPQAMMFVKKLAKHMTRTNGQSLSNTMASFRRRLHFEPLKATLINIKAASDGYIYLLLLYYKNCKNFIKGSEDGSEMFRSTSLILSSSSRSPQPFGLLTMQSTSTIV